MYKCLQDCLNWLVKISFLQPMLSFSGTTGFTTSNLLFHLGPERQRWLVHMDWPWMSWALQSLHLAAIFPPHPFLFALASIENKASASKPLFLQWPCGHFDSEYYLTACSFTSQLKATENIYINWELSASQILQRARWVFQCVSTTGDFWEHAIKKKKTTT